jgi:surface protein
MRSLWFACYLCRIRYLVIYSLLILTFTNAHTNLISHISTRHWIKRSYANDFNQNIGSWDVSSVTNMNRMFLWVLRYALEWWSSWFACYLCCILYWEIHSLLILTFTHAHANHILHISTRPWIKRSYATDFNQDIGSWDVSSVTDMSRMFAWVLRDAFEMKSLWFACYLCCILF